MVVIIFAISILCITVIFSGLSNVGRVRNIQTKKNLFPNEFLSNNQQIIIEPVDGIYATWIVVYIYQAIWIFYAASLTLKCDSPEIINKKVYATYLFALTCNIVWMFIWCRSIYSLGFVFYILQAVSLDICLYFATSACLQYLENFPQARQSPVVSHLWAFRLLVINGISFFTGWVSTTGLVDLAVVLQVDLDVPGIPASKVCLSLLAIGMITWAVIQNFVCQEQTRFMFAEYIPIMVVLGGMIAKEWNHEHEEIRFFALALFVISLMLCLFRLGMIITQEAKRGALQFGNQEAGENVKLI